MRLNAFLARAGVASRRRADDLIRAGRVRVNGHVGELSTVVGSRDVVEVDGRRVERQPLAYVLLHKPPGVVTTAFDPHGRPTVVGLVDHATRVVPVGRLDADTTGALLLTLAGQVPPVAVYAATGLVGVGYAGAQVFPMAMLPDTAAVDAARSGSNRAGVFTGVWTAGETLGLALGPGIFGLVLAAGGYVSSRATTATQPDSAVTAIVLGFSALPAALALASLWWLSRYSLTPAQVADAMATSARLDADPTEEPA